MIRRLLAPGLSTLAMLAVLIGLGTWQVERLAWKTALLARIDAAERSPAVAFDPAAAPFSKLLVEGTLRPELSVLYGAFGHDTPRGPQMGAELVSVLERPGAPPLLVDRGWVPGLPAEAGPVAARFEGYLRPGERAGMFAAGDDPGGRRFYTLDPRAIGAALGLRGVADHVLVALGQQGVGPPGGTPPVPAQALPRPPNNHLSYAITWFGLAAALLVIFAVYARKVLRDDRL